MNIIKKPELGPFMTFEHSKKQPVYRWFWYKEGFSPEIVNFALLREKNISNILDPFCGVGTTLLAAKSAGIQSAGIDSSSLAVFVSRTKTDDYSEKEITRAERFAKEIFRNIGRSSLKWQFELFNPFTAFPKKNFNTLLFLREKIEEEDEKVRNLLLLALLSILPRVGIFIKDGGVLKIKKRKPAIPVKSAFRRKVKEIVNDLKTSAVKGPKPEVVLGDARAAELEDESIDSVFTSPPYLNNIDYSKVYGLELTLLELSKRATKDTRRRSIRSFISKEGLAAELPPEVGEVGKRIPVIGMYFADMEKAIQENWRVLKQGGAAYHVVSNSVIHETHVLVDEVLAEIGERIGFNAEIIVGGERIADVRPHKIKTRESIVVLRK